MNGSHSVTLCFLLFVFAQIGTVARLGEVKAAETLRALEECPKSQPTCVMMQMSLLWLKKPSDNFLDHPIVVAEHEHLSQGDGRARSAGPSSDYRLIVTGRLNEGEIRNYELLVRNYWDRIRCWDFMVPTLGVWVPHGGIIVTDKGTLKITDTPLRFGCHNCVGLIDKQSLKQSFKISPTWGQQGLRKRFVFQKDGGVYWKMDAACLAVSSQGLFKQTTPERCMSSEPRRAEPEAVARVQEAGIFKDEYENERLIYDLYEIEDAPFFIYIYGVACT